MSESHPYEWWRERLEVARDESTTPGSRSFFAGCPVHGGSDSFHVTEVRGGDAKVYCFGGCGATKDFAAALDTVSAEPLEAPQASQSGEVVVARTRRRSAEEGLSPLAWCAQRCGMTLAELEDLSLPLSERGDRLIFEFEGRAAKTRAVGEEKRKDITWEGAVNPPFWPVPREPDPEITVTEGEFDAIVLIRSGYDAYSITGGAGSTPDVAAFVALRDLGVERVVVAFDEDEAGRKGRQSVTEAIRAAGLIAIYARPKGLEPLYDEKDSRDVAARTGALVELEDHPDTELKVRVLASIQPAVESALLIGRLDPNDHTILFGDGGTGKGVIAAWWASQLTVQKMKILILDYENHAETEWRKRVEAFGGDMDKVYVVSPTAAIWDIAGSVAELIKELRVEYVIVDSAIYACVGSDAYTPEAATKYSLAIGQFGKPVLTLAHKTKSKDEQTKPFGSVFWHNGARLIVSVEAKGYDDDRVLKTTKSNHGDDFHLAVDWSWVRNGLPARLDEKPVALSATQSLDSLIIRAVEDGHAVTRADVDNYVLSSDPDAKNIGNRLLALRASGMISYDKSTKEYGPKEPE